MTTKKGKHKFNPVEEMHVPLDDSYRADIEKNLSGSDNKINDSRQSELQKKIFYLLQRANELRFCKV